MDVRIDPSLLFEYSSDVGGEGGVAKKMSNDFERLQKDTTYPSWTGGAKTNFANAMKTLNEAATIIVESTMTVSTNAKLIAAKYRLIEQGNVTDNSIFG